MNKGSFVWKRSNSQYYLYYLTHDSPYDVVGFTVDRDYMRQERVCLATIVPFEDVSFSAGWLQMLVSSVINRSTNWEQPSITRQKIRDMNWSAISVQSHNLARAGRRWQLRHYGKQCATTFATIGNNVVITVGNIIRHHTVIGITVCCLQCCRIGQRYRGGILLLRREFLMRDGIVIARECVVGAGLLLKNTWEEVYIGNPAHLFPQPSNQLKFIYQV